MHEELDVCAPLERSSACCQLTAYRRRCNVPALPFVIFFPFQLENFPEDNHGIASDTLKGVYRIFMV